jgi:TolB-like protein
MAVDHVDFAMILEFAPFRLDTDRAELIGAEGPVALEPKAFALLLLLAENHHRVISKDEMIATVWAGRFISDDAVSTVLKLVRKALNDDGATQAYIRTIRGRGHRFVATVQIVASAALPAQAHAAPLPGPEAERGEKPTVAVLPFARLGLTDDLATVADAIPAEIISSLSRLRWLRVIARESTFRFRHEDVDLGTLNSLLGAGFCLSGRVERIGTRLGVSIDLSDTRSGSVIWSDHIERPLDEVHEIRNLIVASVISALDLRIPQVEAELARTRPVEQLDAWSLYHLGLSHMFRFNGHDNAIAGSLFRRATVLDPGFAAAHAARSFTSYQDAAMRFTADRAAAVADARAAAERSFELDPLDPSANFAMGRFPILTGAPDDGLIWLDRAVELSPSYAKGYYSRSMIHVLAGRTTETRAGLDLSTLLSPLDPLLGPMRGIRAISLLIDGETGMAADGAVRAAQTSSAHFITVMCAIIACQCAGQTVRAAHWLEVLRDRRPDARASHFLNALPFADPAFRATVLAALAAAGLPD